MASFLEYAIFQVLTTKKQTPRPTRQSVTFIVNEQSSQKWQPIRSTKSSSTFYKQKVFVLRFLLRMALSLLVRKFWWTKESCCRDC